MNEIYLDNAATSFPKPELVANSVNKAIKIYGANPGRSSYLMSQKTAEEIFNTRLKIANFFNLEKCENVIFTKNCTEAINIVLFSKLKEGDHIVISDLEHNSVLRPVHYLTKKGVSYSIFRTYESDEETLSSLRSSIKNNTKLMLCTAASNVFGFKLPISKLCALCHIYEIETCIDAAQLAGIDRIDMKNQSIDYLCIPSHKGLYGIMGSGALLCSNDKLSPLSYGGTGTLSLNSEMPDFLPDMLESGTLNVPGILSMSAGIDFINSIGIDRIFTSELNKTIKIYNAFSDIKKVILYTNKPQKSTFVPLLSFNIKDKNCEEVAEFLSKYNICVRSGLHCSPLAHKKLGTLNGTVRVSTSMFNTDKQIDFFINTIKKYTKS